MSRRVISDKYRLELHWSKVIYDREGMIKFINPCFSGPGLKNSAKINDNDFISLDMTSQHTIFIPNYYIAKLSWEKATYLNNKVLLGDTTLMDKNINVTPKLKNDDYFVIDLKEHEEKTHAFNLVYYCEMRNNKDGYYDYLNGRK